MLLHASHTGNRRRSGSGSSGRDAIAPDRVFSNEAVELCNRGVANGRATPRGPARVFESWLPQPFSSARVSIPSGVGEVSYSCLTGVDGGM